MVRKNVIQENSYHKLLRNNIALIINKNSSSQNIQQISDLSDERIKKITIGDPDIVPAGRYALQVLKHFNLTNKIQDKLVLAKDEQAVLTYVELGYADVGFVYQSSTYNNSQIKTISIAPEDSHQPINYSIAIVRNSSHLQLSQEFLQFLQGNTARKIFEKYQFNMAETK